MFYGRGGDERSIAGEYEHLIVGREGFAGDHEGVSGAALFGLEDEIYAERSDGFADAFGLVSDDDEDIARGDDLGGGGYDVGEDGFAGDFVEDLRVPGLEARAFAGGHDGDGHAQGNLFFVWGRLCHIFNIRGKQTGADGVGIY